MFSFFGIELYKKVKDGKGELLMSIVNVFFKMFCLYFLAFAFFAEAYDASPRCFRDLELNFFQPALVSQALSNHRVDQSVWTPINQILKESSRQVPSLLRERVKYLNVNPLSPVFIPEPALKILEEILFRIFSETLISYNSYQDLRINGEDIKNMFDYIKREQASKIENCFKINKKTRG